MVFITIKNVRAPMQKLIKTLGLLIYCNFAFILSLGSGKCQFAVHGKEKAKLLLVKVVN